ncbi:MAG: hypothetical protein ACK40G_03060 [Cytophagaceae bacterium]
MKPSNKILFALPLLLNLVGRILKQLDVDFGLQIIMSSSLALVLLIVYLIIQNGKKYILYSIPIFLEIFSLTGSLFRILHWPGSGPMIMIGVIGHIVASFLLIKNYLSPDSKPNYLYRLLLGIALLIQLLFVINLSTESIWYAKLINYPIVAISGTIILNNSTKNIGERNMILVILAQGLLFIIRHSFELIKYMP